MSNNREAQDEASWLTGEWTAKLAGSIEMMTEQRPRVTSASRIPVNAPEVPPEALWYSVLLDHAPGTAFFIGAAHENWLQIGKSALLAAGVGEVSETDARGTYVEIINQATSSTAQSIAARMGKAVASLPATEGKLSDLAGSAGLIPIEISLNDPPSLTIYLAWSATLEHQLSSSSKNGAEQPIRSGGTAIGRPEFEKSRTLDVLMEVELPVSVSFGRTELPLREVLKLNSGSIVELNRTISDPVEIIVNNCVIARGEVVVVDGNYGVRIQQVISREERLRTLK